MRAIGRDRADHRAGSAECYVDVVGDGAVGNDVVERVPSARVENATEDIWINPLSLKKGKEPYMRCAGIFQITLKDYHILRIHG